MKTWQLSAAAVVLLAVAAIAFLWPLVANRDALSSMPQTQPSKQVPPSPAESPVEEELSTVEPTTFLAPESDMVAPVSDVGGESTVPTVEVDVAEDPPQPVAYAEGHASKSLRNDDFPSTYISAIHVNLTSPDHWVELTWSGPQADRMETGPFRSSPGAGLGYNNCDDADESNRNGSNCTPKGTWAVQGFSDYLRTYPACQFVTWFSIPREVAFHYH